MKDKYRKILLLCLAALLLGLLLAKPGYYLFREIQYRLSDPTSAQQTVYNYARQLGIPYGSYPRSLIELLEGNEETEDFVLRYPTRDDIQPDLSSYSTDTVPLFLQWDPMWGYTRYGSDFLAITGCGPTCLAMAGYYLTGDINMTPSQIATFAEKNGYYEAGYGSSWTLISKGASQLGLEARELPLVKKKMVTALEEGNPIILAMGAGDFTTTGHYILLTGVEDGGFRVNDPNSLVNSQKIWTYEQLESQIRNIWVISKP